jgi:DNA-binding MarR family transcriptional regulator
MNRATRAWAAMHTLVTEANDRRRVVADALDMSFIRVKGLRYLATAPMTIRDLADKLHIDAPYTTVVIDDLERRGLVQRSVDSRDRRRRIVTVTPEGTRQAAEADRILYEPPEALRNLPAADLAALERIVTALLPPSAAGRSASDPGPPPAAPSTSPPRGAAGSGTSRRSGR